MPLDIGEGSSTKRRLITGDNKSAVGKVGDLRHFRWPLVMVSRNSFVAHSMVVNCSRNASTPRWAIVALFEQTWHQVPGLASRGLLQRSRHRLPE